MKPVYYGALLLLGAFWGASFLFIGVAVAAFGPFYLMFLRVFVAGLILLALALLRQRPRAILQTLQLRQRWPKYLTVGLFNCALPFTLIAYAEIKVPASLAAILISTMPLFTAVIASVWGNEQLHRGRVWGVVLGIVGVGVLVGGGSLALTWETAVAVVALLLAACSYSLATVYASKNLHDLPSIYAAIMQLLGAAVLLGAPAIGAMPVERPLPRCGH